MLAQRLTNLLPVFIPDSGDPESYLRTTLGYIEQTALHNFPHEILGSLQKALGIGTPAAPVPEGFSKNLYLHFVQGGVGMSDASRAGHHLLFPDARRVTSPTDTGPY